MGADGDMGADSYGGTVMPYFVPADILIPKLDDMQAWSVVACDQFTSEPEYWDAVRARVGDKPSTLSMILPEAELGTKDQDDEYKKIYAAMQKYLDDGIFGEYKNSYVVVERTLADGSVRRGLIGAVDLEYYDYSENSVSPVRATEHTVEDRLPPRVKIRMGAALELPHIMVFADDPEDTVISAAKKGEILYNFELMQGGGRIKGWQVDNADKVMSALERLSDENELSRKYGTSKNAVIIAMGDGNHSIAAAKKYWNEIKDSVPEPERASHPARYALAELVNIHDPAIVFEPIHKVIFGTDPTDFIEAVSERFKDGSGEEKLIKVIAGACEKDIQVCGLTLGLLIGECEKLCKAYTDKHGGSIDYIHGDNECMTMSRRDGCCGILLPKMDKSELFSSVMRSGPFPKKSFSIGLGCDKRYYLECRKIK